jgi:para-aminobenzoate synthetase/4-amino-4-deoxychorismate lyase
MKNLDTLLEQIESLDNVVLLETNRYDKKNKKSLLFLNPLKVITCNRGEKLKDKINEVEREIKKGRYAAGFLSYEAGYFFESSLSTKNKYDFPLLWFGIYKKPLDVSLPLKTPPKQEFFLREKPANIDYKRYKRDIEKIKEHLAKGDVYQINYTFKKQYDYAGDWKSLYKNLRQSQKVSYAAVIKSDKKLILSLSPELFFRKEGRLIETHPMKGTYERGRNQKEDKKNINLLKNSAKDRSENLMIVDLLRNDFGRISKMGSIDAKKLFKVEKYKTLLQMISVVKGKLDKQVSLYDIFKSTFPCGSVTGAPKIRAMQIIRALEKEPRGIYTGSIGYISPQKKSVFNVAIRTLVLETDKKKAQMGIGSGIVYDSDKKKEFKECLLKADFTKGLDKDFELIETILVKENKKIDLLSYHLKRLKNSLKYFEFCYNEGVIKDKLQKHLKKLNNSKKYKLRLLHKRDGSFKISSRPLSGAKQESLKVAICPKKVNSGNIFLYHKTTNRELYDKEYKKALKQGLAEVFFFNEKDQLTEGAISNIIIKKDNCYYTPPLNCGLLNGVYREYLFNKKDFPLKEKILYIKDLKTADNIFVCNSLRGLREVKII